MIRLLEMYWAWRNIKTVFRTVNGHRVIRVGNKFAVKDVMPGNYRDLSSGGFIWTKDSRHFKDCLGSRYLIEKEFGAILGLPVDDKDVA